ncbi:protein farnesyltransferase KNAG_0A05770 [Huiozyma naganishii CBS 8797]|uniref:Protein farnesyltransferase subunit beta n=1 Tax=Huiozyma naganishii (strain ATCC MYA-139 / BCRC 22969 / CBS 8797 / KCTC 17520 / NBRC 10181 / NCYC 3082 / Yp74L-3) TaxID=1071383 RepID=J7R0B4_HUIN7|nr:hypothetical protein KNAG_0A05770 [Kazachstania naganishii CBS 8797]CCK68240.1 hypothetical protein KNAG_0A05770 [Kazachstania naganishii CBS 8797]
MDQSQLRRARFIDSSLLGRKRSVQEQIAAEGGQGAAEEEVIPIMKEVETETTIDRQKVLMSCKELLQCEIEPLHKDFHREYLDYVLAQPLPPQMTALDASQPWMLYWVANSLASLNEEWLNDDVKIMMAKKLNVIGSSKTEKMGPFGGGIGQMPHIAGTYASINALALCGNIENCWDYIDRESIYQWLLSLKQSNGGFKTCVEVGEVDTRGVYCALSIASMLNIMTEELVQGVVQYLVSCQTYEGGFGGCPQEDEAHGGYTFCAVASLMILDALDQINVDKLLEWCSARQLNEEKGLNGRNNKLVDGCYSFWVGATGAILETKGYVCPIDKNALHEYICQCCQDPAMPGLRDKPGKHADLYHTNYVLLGLAITEAIYTETSQDGPVRSSPALHIESTTNTKLRFKTSGLSPINPVYGVPVVNLRQFAEYFHHK